MRILGVDPGTLHTGVGIIEAQGNRYSLVHAEVISPKASLPVPQRLFEIFQRLTQIVSEYQPEILSLENVFFGKDLRAMIKIGEARACAMLAAAKDQLEVCEYPPARIKQAVTGNGRATKKHMQWMIQKLLNLSKLPKADAADALAVAICHLQARGDGRVSALSKQLGLLKKGRKTWADIIKEPGRLVER